jgi:hypothetical protein
MSLGENVKARPVKGRLKYGGDFRSEFLRVSSQRVTGWNKK